MIAINKKYVGWVILLILGLATAIMAQPTSNGVVGGSEYQQTFNDPGASYDVGMPGTMTGISGNNLQDVRLYYDPTTGRMYFAINTYTIAGDVDDDGDPGGSSAALLAAGGIDHPDFGGTEAIVMVFDFDEDGNYDVIAGVPAGGDFSDFKVCHWQSGHPQNDIANGFGSEIGGRLGGVSGSPSSGAPDVEFSLNNFFTLPGQDAELLSFGFNVYIGSTEDDGIGEDYLVPLGQTFEVELALLGDRVWYDDDADGIQDGGEDGVSGVTVELYTSGGSRVTSTTTDSNGEYLMVATSGDYYIKFVLPSGRIFTLQDQGSDLSDSDADQTTGQTDVFTVAAGDEDYSYDAGLLAPATISNLVWEDTDGDGVQDSGEPGVSGVTVQLYTSGNVLSDTQVTDGSGLYMFEDVFPGSYYVTFTQPQGSLSFTRVNYGGNDAFDSDANRTTGQTGTFTVASAEDKTDVDAGIVWAASFGDYVWEDMNGNGDQETGEDGIGSVSVALSGTRNDGVSFSATSTTTDANGAYLFSDLYPGSYAINVTIQSGWAATAQDDGQNDTVDSDINASGVAGSVSLVSGQNYEDRDAGLYQPITIGDFVWDDMDMDGVQESGEAGIENLSIQLVGTTGAGISVNRSATSSSTGAYSFTNVAPGTYHVVFPDPEHIYDYTYPDQGDDALDSDADRSTGSSPNVTVVSGDDISDIDAGYIDLAEVNGMVFIDEDYDGTRETGDNGVSGVTVELRNTGGLVATTTTDGTGAYQFIDIFPGDYFVRVTRPGTALDFTQQDLGSDLTDSDVPQGGSTGETTSFSLATNEIKNNVDAGVIYPAIIGDFAWEDMNGDGDQDSGEPGITTVAVSLTGTDNAGAAVSLNTSTNASGIYQFTGLRPGTYTATFTTPTGYEVTPQDVGGDAVDSDITAATGASQAVTVTSGDTDDTIDAGYYRVASVGDFLWHDQDGNGLQGTLEPGIDGVSVTLYTDTNTQVGSPTITTGGGAYSFTDLAPGMYYVQFGTPSGYVRTHANIIGTDAIDSDANEGTGRSHTFTLTSNETDNTVDAGFYQTATLGNFFWNDENYDGIQNDAMVVSGASITLTGTNNVGQAVSSSTTASSGIYQFTGLAPGNYELAFQSFTGWLWTTPDQGGDATDSDVNQSTGRISNISLVSGQVDNSRDAGYVNAAELSGNYWKDLDADGIREAGEAAHAGLTVKLMRTSDDFTVEVTSTNSNGDYSFDNIFPGEYYVIFTPASSSEGSFSPQDQGGDDAVDSDVNPVDWKTASMTLAPNSTTTNVDAGFYYYTQIGDFVWEDLNADGVQDGGESGINGVTVSLLDAAGTPTGTTTNTDGNGAYLFEDVVPGTYRVGFPTPTGYEVSPFQATTSGVDSDVNPATGYSDAFTLTSGSQNLTLDAGFYRNAALGDFVWEDLDGDGVQDALEPGIENISVRLLNAAGDAILATTTTAADGSYGFPDLTPAQYQVQVDFPGTYNATVQDHGGDDADDSDISDTGRSHLVTLTSNETDDSIDAGLYQPVSIGDYAWLSDDVIPDGIQDATGFENITVTLTGTTGAGVSVNQNTATASDGSYDFTNLAPGTYALNFSLPTGYLRVAANQGGDDDLDSDANAETGNVPSVTLASDSTVTNLDAGYVESASVGDWVWNDLNGDGIQDPPTETGVEDVRIRLFNSSNVQVDSTLTSSTGNYLFTDVYPGDYYLEFVQPSNAINWSPQDQGGNDATDSDVSRTTHQTAEFELGAGVDLTNYDAGLLLSSAIGNFVWEDTNADGVQDVGELGISGVAIRLLSSDGSTEVKTGITDGDGEYEFANIEPGSYIVEFTTPTGFTRTDENQGSDDELDSDVLVTSRTLVVSVIGNQTDYSVDAGYYRPATIGNFVWEDMNADGIQDAGEPGAGNVQVQLYTSDDVYSGTQTTGSDGAYEFTGKKPGTYYVRFTSEPDSGFVTTLANQGGNDAVDSDIEDVPSESFQETADFTVVSNQTKDDMDAGYYRYATLGNFVWNDVNADGVNDDGEVGIGDLEVTLLNAAEAVLGSQLTSKPTTTEPNIKPGYFEFTDLVPGVYILQYPTPDSSMATLLNYSLLDSIFDSDANPETGRSVLIPLWSNMVDTSWDAGFVRWAVIGDTVWNDLNADGIQDAGEPGVANVAVSLVCPDDALKNQTTTTDASGRYEFNTVFPGEYYVQFTKPTTALNFVASGQGGDAALDSDVDATGKTANFTVVQNQKKLDIDAGLKFPGSIGNFVWNDADGDGVQDAGETGLSGVAVRLMVSGFATQSTLTDGSGNYLFENLEPGDYAVQFSWPTGYLASPRDNSGDDDTDSDMNPSTSTTAQFALASSENNLSVDAGFYQSSSISNFVWEDLDADGIQDSGEPGISGVTVRLLDGGDNSILDTKVTDGNGAYSFSGLSFANYKVEIVLPTGYQVTTQNAGSNTAVDSDISAVDNRTVAFDLAIGEDNETIDAGLYRYASIGDFVWNDDNYDGDQDTGETGIENVTVTLLNTNFTTTGKSTLTDGNGAYAITEIVPGSYVLEFSQPAGLLPTLPDLGGNDATDSDIDRTTRRTAVFTLASNDVDITLDAGFNQPAGSIGDFVWEDMNVNGVQDAGELGIENVTVQVYNSSNVEVRNTTTAADGSWSVIGLEDGSYYVTFVLPTDYYFTAADQGGDDTADSDANITTGRTQTFALPLGGENLTLDAGMYQLGSIGDFTWVEKDRDGIFETNEQPLENVSVELRNSSDDALAAGGLNTDASGNYLFENVVPGSYYLTFTSPNAMYYALSPQNQGADETRDNDANPTNGRTLEVFLPSGVDTLDVDAGFYYVDTDNDSIPNVVEGPDDRDGDGDLNLADYDPKGFIYDQVTGNLVTGGTISVSGAGAGSVNITEDGSTGLYQFFVSSATPVNFTLSYTPPDGYMMSTTCDAQASTLNPTPLPTPSVIELGSGRNGSGNQLMTWDCSNNTYYWLFTLGQDDPFIINNNIPLMRSMPIAEFEADSTSGIDELCVQFNNLSRYGDTYLWDFGDGVTSTEENPLHCYNSSQKYYTVSLTATNVSGSDTETKTDYIVIVKQAVVNFTVMPLVGHPGTEVQFMNNSGGLISNWLWEFGDNEQLGLRHGTISSEKVHPAHIYEQSGEYTVSLKGWGQGGESMQIFEDMVCIDSTWAELELLDGSDVEDGFGWEKVLDNDLFSQRSYVAAENDGAWAVFGFADTTLHLIDKVRLHANDAYGRIFRNNLAKDFEVWVSVDNVTFEKHYSGTLSQKMAWEMFVFEPVGAKYIKLVIPSAVGENSPKICLGEFQVFGIPVTEVSLGKNASGLLSMVMGELVTDFALTQNYPNPFNPETTISFDVPEQAQVKLAVFNVTGQKVADLVNREVNAGRYKFSFDAHQLPSGVYFYRIEAGHFNATKRMLLIK